jgi:TonB family protein
VRRRAETRRRPLSRPRVETPGPAQEEATPEVAPIAKSEIEIPTPAATATPTPTLKPTPTPSPKPPPKATPRPTPKPTPKPKPKPSATPRKKATPKAKPKPTPDEEAELATKQSEKKKAIAKAAPAREKSGESDEESSEKPVKKTKAASGVGGQGSGAAGAAEFGWYGNMLHDRFYSEWVQPTSVVHSAKLSVLLRIRIQNDGRISDYSIAKSSGNPVVDDSVTAAAARVKQVDPLPSGLGDGYYDVNINFELN